MVTVTTSLPSFWPYATNVAPCGEARTVTLMAPDVAAGAAACVAPGLLPRAAANADANAGVLVSAGAGAGACGSAGTGGSGRAGGGLGGFSATRTATGGGFSLSPRLDDQTRIPIAISAAAAAPQRARRAAGVGV